MASTFDFSKLKDNPETKGIIVDLFMLLLVAINLAWIFFDWLFTSQFIQSGVASVNHDFYVYYRDTVHPNFVAYDLIFVSIYLTELAIRWAIAVYKQTYHRWFFYPFVHWYDVLGSIPIGSFRFLRILRVVAILYRLQKMGVVKLENNAFYAVFNKYTNILTEEITDRVVLSVLNGLQEEVRGGHPVTEDINKHVIQPRAEELNLWVKVEVGSALRDSFVENEREIKDYLANILANTLSKQGRIGRIGFVDNRIRQISRQISDSVIYELIGSIIEDLTDPETRRLGAITDAVSERINQQARDYMALLGEESLIDIIQTIKEYVQIQQWKIEEEERAAKNR